MEQVQTIKYSKQKNKLKIGFIIATIVVLVGAISMIFPYLWMFFTSFKNNYQNMIYYKMEVFIWLRSRE